MEKKLTVKQQRFVAAYIETGNATESARRAGYSKKTAEAIGLENLRKPRIKESIQKRLQEIDDAQIADAREVLRFLTSAMRGNVQEEVIVVEGIGDGASEARIMKKQLSAHERLDAAKQLAKRYGLSEAESGDSNGEVTIIDDTGPIE